MANNLLHVRIISPQQLILDTENGLSVSSKNLAGPFDILPGHANFITMVENSPITVRSEGLKPQVFKFPLAICLVTNNTVNIYTYIQPDLEKK